MPDVSLVLAGTAVANVTAATSAIVAAICFIADLLTLMRIPFWSNHGGWMLMNWLRPRYSPQPGADQQPAERLHRRITPRGERFRQCKPELTGEIRERECERREEEDTDDPGHG